MNRSSLTASVATTVDDVDADDVDGGRGEGVAVADVDAEEGDEEDQYGGGSMDERDRGESRGVTVARTIAANDWFTYVAIKDACDGASFSCCVINGNTTEKGHASPSPLPPPPSLTLSLGAGAGAAMMIVPLACDVAAGIASMHVDNASIAQNGWCGHQSHHIPHTHTPCRYIPQWVNTLAAGEARSNATNTELPTVVVVDDDDKDEDDDDALIWWRTN